MSEAEFQRVCAKFDELGVVYTKLEHAEARTSAEAAANRGGQLADGVKSLLVKFSRKGKDFFAVLNVPADKRLDSNKAMAVLQTGELRFAKEDEVLQLTGCQPGGVPPFGYPNDLAILVDKKIFSRNTSEFNTGLKTKSVRLATSDLKKVFDSIGVAYFDLSE